MRSAFAVLSISLLILVLLAWPRSARADQGGGHTVGVAVLAFDAEGGAEEQADAMSGALRSRIRNAPGWQLVETTQTLPLLTAANKCSIRPAPDCQVKISEQIKSDRYIWGIVSKAGPGQVTAEVHLFQRGHEDVSFKETYADNLKDPQDDKGLGKVAARFIAQLSSQVIGIVVVHAGTGDGEVVVDGDKRVPVAKGVARLEIAAGSHSIEVNVSGLAPTKRTILVQAGKEASIDVTPPVNAEGDKPFPTRKVIAGVSATAGLVLVAISILSVTQFLDDKSKGEDEAKSVPKGMEPCAVDNEYAKFCNYDKDAKTHSAVAWITGGVGVAAIGLGAYLFFTDPGTEKSPAPQAKKKTGPRLEPVIGTTNGFLFSGSF